MGEDAGEQAINARDDHYCFGCGARNPHGLRLKFFATEDGEGVWAPWTPDRAHEGYTGIVHGGIITTVLDEVMAWALYDRNIWAVTGEIAVRFRRPVEVGVPTRAVGLIQEDRGRLLRVIGELRRAADESVLASATARFMRVPEDQARAWRDRYGGGRRQTADGKTTDGKR